LSSISNPKTIERPWGCYTVLEENASFKIKRIEVNPNASLSLQVHNRRSEHWVVVSGQAKILNNDQEFILGANQSTYIPIGHKHRLSNPSLDEKLVIIEVQCGSYLEEDDIIRFEDQYGRPINLDQDDYSHSINQKNVLNKQTLKYILERSISFYPFKKIKGFVSAFIAYPLAERSEKRQITPKLKELRAYYKKPFDERIEISRSRLINILSFAGENVPYYKDLYKKHKFNPQKIEQDIRYLEKLPYLTKEIVREEKDRLLSRALNEYQHYIVKTGGSTGPSCHFYYDQSAYDYSAAVTLFARESIGKYKWLDAIHFACRFPGEIEPKWPSREDFKCFAMNRSNIFFDRLDDKGLEEILASLKRRKPYLIHAHPSTIYALACYVEKEGIKERLFDVFESSGEMLQVYMQDRIKRVFDCKVINRYGLAEFGVIAYQFQSNLEDIKILDSEGFAETRINNDNQHEIVFTGYRNYLMPLIRYATGDEAEIDKGKDGIYLKNLKGRIHHVIPINGILYPTHYIMDILDHRVGGIQEFQIDMNNNPPVLRLVLESFANKNEVNRKILNIWPNEFVLEFTDTSQLISLGHRAKFMHVVMPNI
jgi:phenylacetate-CoA ligase